MGGRRAALLPAVLALAAAFAHAQTQLPQELEGVGIEEKLGSQVEMSLTFTAENGYPVELKQFFSSGRPVILNLVYYSCPMLCTLVLNGQTAALREMTWTPGNEFEIVTISIDPADTFQLAQQKRAAYLSSYGRQTSGWHFLTDRDGNVKKLAAQAGFNYRWDERTQQFAHAAAIIVLTPGGKVSRYLYGIKYNPRDVRLALVEAAKERFAPLSPERVLLYCFHYDPNARSYVLFATNFMRVGGVAAMLAIALMLFRYWRRERAAA